MRRVWASIAGSDLMNAAINGASVNHCTIMIIHLLDFISSRPRRRRRMLIIMQMNNVTSETLKRAAETLGKLYPMDVSRKMTPPRMSGRGAMTITMIAHIAHV